MKVAVPSFSSPFVPGLAFPAVHMSLTWHIIVLDDTTHAKSACSDVVKAWLGTARGYSRDFARLMCLDSSTLLAELKVLC